jgi:hypothetical protein
MPLLPKVLPKVSTGDTDLDRIQDAWMNILNPVLARLGGSALLAFMIEHGVSSVRQLPGWIATMLYETEILLTTSPIIIPSTPGRIRGEIQNNGPNSILVGPSTTQQLRVIPAGQSWTVDYDGVLYGKALTAAQVTGAATVLTELMSPAA